MTRCAFIFRWSRRKSPCVWCLSAYRAGEDSARIPDKLHRDGLSCCCLVDRVRIELTAPILQGSAAPQRATRNRCRSFPAVRCEAAARRIPTPSITGAAFCPGPYGICLASHTPDPQTGKLCAPRLNSWPVFPDCHRTTFLYCGFRRPHTADSPVFVVGYAAARCHSTVRILGTSFCPVNPYSTTVASCAWSTASARVAAAASSAVFGCSASIVQR